MAQHPAEMGFGGGFPLFPEYCAQSCAAHGSYRHTARQLLQDPNRDRVRLAPLLMPAWDWPACGQTSDQSAGGGNHFSVGRVGRVALKLRPSPYSKRLDLRAMIAPWNTDGAKGSGSTFLCESQDIRLPCARAGSPISV